jgi:hypothetical protein
MYVHAHGKLHRIYVYLSVKTVAALRHPVQYGEGASLGISERVCQMSANLTNLEDIYIFISFTRCNFFKQIRKSMSRKI